MVRGSPPRLHSANHSASHRKHRGNGRQNASYPHDCHTCLPQLRQLLGSQLHDGRRLAARPLGRWGQPSHRLGRQGGLGGQARGPDGARLLLGKPSRVRSPPAGGEEGRGRWAQRRADAGGGLRCQGPHRPWRRCWPAGARCRRLRKTPVVAGPCRPDGRARTGGSGSHPASRPTPQRAVREPGWVCRRAAVPTWCATRSPPSAEQQAVGAAEATGPSGPWRSSQMPVQAAARTLPVAARKRVAVPGAPVSTGARLRRSQARSWPKR
jgi:hypothetical protein